LHKAEVITLYFDEFEREMSVRAGALSAWGFSTGFVYVNVHILESYIPGVEVFIIHEARFRNHDRIEQ
jgi:hypothetical protein